MEYGDENDNKRESERICGSGKKKTEKRSLEQTSIALPSLRLITVASHDPGYVAQRGAENKGAF